MLFQSIIIHCVPMLKLMIFDISQRLRYIQPINGIIDYNWIAIYSRNEDGDVGSNSAIILAFTCLPYKQILAFYNMGACISGPHHFIIIHIGMARLNSRLIIQHLLHGTPVHVGARRLYTPPLLCLRSRIKSPTCLEMS